MRSTSVESRNEIFKYVRSISDQERKVFVKSMIGCVTPEEKQEGQSRRSLTNIKYVHYKVSGEKERVCKTVPHDKFV